jgi:hypothetical protein
MIYCRALYCQNEAHAHGPFCHAHWFKLSYETQRKLLQARDAHNGARDPIIKAYRTLPAYEAAIAGAVAELAPDAEMKRVAG